jgi:hypothetical protein
VVYSKLCYALLDLKKVVIFAFFNVTIYIEFEILCILSINFFFDKFAFYVLFEK